VKRIIALVVVIVALAGAGFWYFFIRDTAPPKASLTVTVPSTDAGGTTVAPTSGPDGNYAVKPANSTYAGFRIDEEFSGGLHHTAVVRTPSVTGALTLQGTQVNGVSVTADLSHLESKDSQPPGFPGIENRVNSLQFQGLEISKFPTAKFVASAPITLPTAPNVGVKVTTTAHGKLTLHGVTKDVAIPIEARWNGTVIDVAGSLPITLADYSITAPSRPFVTVGDKGTLEFELTFGK
jgi:polyisoprenoid-binding protein YceI